MQVKTSRTRPGQGRGPAGRPWPAPRPLRSRPDHSPPPRNSPGSPSCTSPRTSTSSLRSLASRWNASVLAGAPHGPPPFPRPTQPPKDALAQLSAAFRCDLRSRVRRFESCRRLGPALLWTPGVILNSTEPHVIRPGSAQCPARVAGRLVPYVTDPWRADLRVARCVLPCCVSSPLRVVRCEHRTSLQMDMDPPAGPDRNRLPMFTLTQ